MLEALVESQNRTVRGNKILIALRLFLATVALAILLLQQGLAARNLKRDARTVSSRGEVTALQFDPHGARLYSGATDTSIRIWEMPARTRYAEFISTRTHPRVIAISPDGKKLACGGEDRLVQVFDTVAPALPLLFSCEDHDPNSIVTALAWSADGSKLLSGGGNNPLRVWNGKTGELIKAGGDDSQHSAYAAFVPGGNSIVSVTDEGQIKLFNGATLAKEADVGEHGRPVLAAALAPNGRSLLTGGQSIKSWDLQTRKEASSYDFHSDPVTALSFDASGEHFLSAGRDHKVVYWTVGDPKGKLLGEQSDWVLAAALAPDGKLAATGTGDPLVHVWDTAAGAEVDKLQGHQRTTNRADIHRADARVEPIYLRPEGLVVLIVLLLTIMYTLALKRSALAPKLAALQIFVDVGLISALIYHTGGVDSPFLTLFLISIVAASFVLSWRASVLVAALAAIGFSFVTLAYGLDHAPDAYKLANELQVKKFKNLDLLGYLRLLLLPVCAFFLVALLAGNLSRRLAVARLLHQEVLEGIGEGILVLDMARRVMYHNDEARKLLQVTGVLNTRTLVDLLGPPVDDQASNVLSSAAGRRMEINFKRPDGLIMPLGLRLLPVRDEEDPARKPLRGLIVVLDDITAEKKMEEFYKHKERIETMGQISATIAHEIRNPLASIRGAVQEIARSVEIPENKKILIEIVLTESDRLDQIITDFLRYARIRPPKIGMVDSCQLLSDLRLLLISRPEAKTMDISLSAPEDVEPIKADPEQMRQVFLNLGLNAIQALEGREDARLAFRAREASLHEAQGMSGKEVLSSIDRKGVLIEVEDNGPGITEEVRKQIFEPFFTTKPSGTGLGLATVDRIIQGHEGYISVASGPNKGTIFRVWLPRELQADSAAALPAVETQGHA